MIYVIILMDNNDERSYLVMDNRTSGNNWDISNVMIIYALNINQSSIFLDKMDISTAQSTIGNMVNKGNFFVKV